MPESQPATACATYREPDLAVVEHRRATDAREAAELQRFGQAVRRPRRRRPAAWLLPLTFVSGGLVLGAVGGSIADGVLGNPRDFAGELQKLGRMCLGGLLGMSAGAVAAVALRQRRR